MNRRDIDFDINLKTDSLTIQNIVNIVLKWTGCDYDLFMSKSRDRHEVFSRQLSQYLACKYTYETLNKIGRIAGNRNHATVLHSLSSIQNDIDVKNRIMITIFDKIESDIVSKIDYLSKRPKRDLSIHYIHCKYSTQFYIT